MRYIKSFDGLRAVAVLAVMIAHYLSQYRFLGIFSSSGVTLFFVLSGFLITRILMEQKDDLQVDAKHNSGKLKHILYFFYIRRSLRIFPIYYILLAILVVLNIDSAREFFWYHFLYGSNFLYAFKIGFDSLSHFWSLAVEEQFYLVWPLIILLMPLRINRIKFFGFLFLLSIVFKIIMVSIYSADSLVAYFMMPGCIESFAAGALAVLLIERERKISGGVLLTAFVGTAVVFILLAFLQYQQPAGLVALVYKLFHRSIFSIFCAISLVLLATDSRYMRLPKKILESGFFVWLGKISYGVYLYHLFIPGLLIFLQQKSGINLGGSGLNLLLHFGLTFLIAFVSYQLIEAPINRIKKNYVVSKK